MAVVISAVIFTWGSGFMSMLTEGTGEKSMKEISCMNNVRIDIVSSTIKGDQLSLSIANLGNIDLSDMNIGIVGTDGSQNIVVGEILNKGEVKKFERMFNPDTVGAIKEIVVTPSIIINEDTFVCQNTVSTGDIKTSKDDLILYLSFSNGDGIIAYDGSGNENDGDIHGASWTNEGKKGYALDFEADDYVVVDWPDFTLSQHTIEFWMKTDRIDGLWHDLVGTYTNGDLNRFHLQKGDNSIVWYNMMGGCGTLDSNIIPVVGEWYHIVGTYDGSVFKVYINGELKNSYTCSKTMTSYYCYVAGNVEDFYGKIDEVRIYRRPLSWSEIKMHYLEEND
jgi:hypothetical protein